MGKRPEDEIQQKLVELELSIKDDEAKRSLPAASSATSSNSLSALDTSISGTGEQKPAVADSSDLDWLTLGGYGLVLGGAAMILSHMQITSWFSYFGRTPMTGMLLIPLLVGLGMLFYNYKSRVAQLLTAGTSAVLLFVMLANMTILFSAMSMLDFVIMAVPLCGGAALLAKAHVKRRELMEIGKSDK
jgi:hypothetical protein